MVKKKKETYSDLYIPMNDVSEKRKNLLLSIKNSLLMQEEYEKILSFRAKRFEILKTIKKGVTSINSDFIKIKKHFPNVKNVLSNTEKEISELENQISLLKSSSVNNTDEIARLSGYEKSLLNGGKLEAPEPVKEPEVPEVIEVPIKKPVKKKPAKKVIKKPLTKKERVRNNLKALESKLKNL